MAKPAAKDEPAGMDKAELRKHLRFAKAEPIMVAFALDESGKAIVQLDKRKPGRALEKMLKDDAPGSKNHRWGTAVVDPDDEKTIRFTINKPGGGMARKLSVALKGTGFSKIKLLLGTAPKTRCTWARMRRRARMTPPGRGQRRPWSQTTGTRRRPGMRQWGPRWGLRQASPHRLLRRRRRSPLRMRARCRAI